MPITIPQGFDIQGPDAVEKKSIQDTLLSRDSIPLANRYEGLKVYVIANQQNYQLLGGITNDKWVLIASGQIDHTTLTNLSWLDSGHTGTPSRLVSFDSSGVASETNPAIFSTDIHANITALNAVLNTNTGDETNFSIKAKLGVATPMADGYLSAFDYSLFTAKQDDLGFTPENTSNKNQANGYAGLDAGAKVSSAYLPSTLLLYKSTWDALTNTPGLLATDVTKKGFVYTVSVAGTRFAIDWKLGDWAIYNDAGIIEKSDNSDDVTSVNGQQGPVSLTTDNIPDATQTNKYVTATEKTAITHTNRTALDNVSGTNTGDNAINSNYSGLVSNATHTGDATGATALTVVKIQGKAVPTLSVLDDQKYLKYDNASGTFIMAVPTDTWIALTGIVSGYVTAEGSSNTAKYLNGNGAWSTPPDTTYSAFAGSTSVLGLVPLRVGATTTKYLREDGSWVIPPDTNTWIALTGTVSGYVTNEGNSDTTKFLNGNGAWSVPIVPTMTNLVGGLVPTPPNNTTTFLRGDGTFATVGGGDMLLNGVQSVTGEKTFINTKLLLRNAANTFNGSFLNNNTADRVYTLKDADGTLAFTTDIANSRLESYSTTATTAGTTTLTSAFNYMQYFTGTLTHTVVLPVVSTLSLGFQFKIINSSTQPVLINSSGSNLILSLATTREVILTCIAITGTGISSWSVEQKLPALTFDKIWLGDATNNAVEVATAVSALFVGDYTNDYPALIPGSVWTNNVTNVISGQLGDRAIGIDELGSISESFFTQYGWTRDFINSFITDATLIAALETSGNWTAVSDILSTYNAAKGDRNQTYYANGIFYFCYGTASHTWIRYGNLPYVEVYDPTYMNRPQIEVGKADNGTFIIEAKHDIISIVVEAETTTTGNISIGSDDGLADIVAITALPTTIGVTKQLIYLVDANYPTTAARTMYITISSAATVKLHINKLKMIP